MFGDTSDAGHTAGRAQRLRADILDLAPVLLAVVKVRRLLSNVTVTEAIAQLERSAPETGISALPFWRARRLGQLVNGVANRLPGEVNCLPRSLATWHLLRRRGCKPVMPIGVRVDEAGARYFHTWVELNGLPLNDRYDVRSRYRILSADTAPDGAAVWDE